MAQGIKNDTPPERMVRHVFWKYPILAAVMLVVVAVVAAAIGSPNYPRDTIAGAAKTDPAGFILSFTQELDGMSPSAANAQENGVGDPGETFVMGPLRAAAPILGDIQVEGLAPIKVSDLRTAISAYDSASADQRMSWASSYDNALGTITTQSSGMGAMSGPMSPDLSKIGSLQGDFGPVPTMVESDLYLAATGYLQQYLEALDPGHSLHLVNICLYDHPMMLNTAIDQGLTDDQWGMVKERNFSVGPWYLFVPAVFHVYFPGGSTGRGFVLWNIAFALVLIFAVPLIPGIRDLPGYLKLYRFIYRYPLPGDMETKALQERHGPVHGGGAA
jgi:hypothetical protein